MSAVVICVLPFVIARTVETAHKDRERRRRQDEEKLEAAREKLRIQRSRALKDVKRRDLRNALADWQESFDALDR